eukprot:6115192-Pyramimonas_sp.AAC.1
MEADGPGGADVPGDGGGGGDGAAADGGGDGAFSFLADRLAEVKQSKKHKKCGPAATCTSQQSAVIEVTASDAMENEPDTLIGNVPIALIDAYGFEH